MAQGSQTDRRRVLLVFLAVGMSVLLVDQVTKHLSVIYLEDRDPVRLLWGAVYLTLVRNSGAVMSRSVRRRVAPRIRLASSRSVCTERNADCSCW